MCKDVLTVIVGSQLHGLARPESDEDFRGVFINDVRDIVNPFEKPEDKRFIEGKGKDDTASEIRKFIMEVTKGNPNSIEVLFSHLVVPEGTTDIGYAMQDNAYRFIDTAEVFRAYKNYSENQLNKMALFDPNDRTPKFAVAYIRSLLNGVQLLREGTITNPVPESFKLTTGDVIAAKSVLEEIKYTPYKEFDRVRPLATAMFTKLQIELATVFYSTRPQRADTEWIIGFCEEAYGVH